VKKSENSWKWLKPKSYGCNGNATGAKSSNVTPIPEKKWNEARAKKLAGLTWDAIAAEVGVPIGTLKSRWSREKMQSVAVGMRSEIAKIPDRISQNTDASIEDISRRVRDLLAADSLATSLRVQQYSPSDIREESMREGVMGSLVKRSAQVLGWESASSTVQVQVGVIASLPDRPASESIE
jgi:hypothetical protein